MSTIHEQRLRQNVFQGELEQKGWYHSFELPDGSLVEGTMSLAWERERWARFGLPESLAGKRLLDIGAWDGWFSFEAERRGAQVVSVDYFEYDTYRRMHRLLGSRADYRNLEIYELPQSGLGSFDVVLCLGVLYHLKHPLLGLEIVCGLSSDVAFIETFVTDGETWREHGAAIPAMEFYETSELNGNLDNWTGPTVGCLLAMCRTAGFARVELAAVDRENALVRCSRRWEPAPENPVDPPPELTSAVNNVTYGINFSTRRDDYVSCWFRSPAASLTRHDLRLEVGEFGSPAIAVAPLGEGTWVASCRLPPGTPPGWIPVQLRLAGSQYSNPLRIAVDMPPNVGRIDLKGVYDGVSWRPGEASQHLACWVLGLPENADLHNVRLLAGERRLRTEWVGEPDGEGCRQVNAALPADLPRGPCELRVECGGVASAPAALRVA